LGKLVLEKAGKKFRKEWIFRNLDYSFEENKSYVILGPNGSGKSTLLKLCASYITPTEGLVKYIENENEISQDFIHQHITMATPYMELPEEFTPLEILDFHLGFKTFYNSMSKSEFLELVNLVDAKDKPLNKFSSGMKQRFKIGLAIVSKSDMLFLDEPVINLDAAGISLYRNLITEFNKDRIIIICSNNIEAEFDFCDSQINVEHFKN